MKNSTYYLQSKQMNKPHHITKPTNYSMNGLQKFLLICSGANLSLIRKSPGEWNKFAGIGGVILFTAIFATVSASYALYTVFDNLFTSIAFGILWGLMIFNLDRYIVASIKKTGSFWHQFIMAMPRVLLAAFLGIIISKPLELKVFEKEVNKQLNTIIQRNKTQLQADMNARILQQSSPFENEKNQIAAKTQELQAAYDSAAIELEKEILGTKTNLTSGKVGFGSNAKRKSELKEQRRKDLEQYQLSIQPRQDYLNQEISKVYTQIETEREKTEGVEERFNGLAARLQALDELGDQSKVMAIASMFIMGLFIALEISPVLVKIISPVGPYDYLLEESEDQFRIYTNEKRKKNTMASEFRIENYPAQLKESNSRPIEPSSSDGFSDDSFRNS